MLIVALAVLILLGIFGPVYATDITVCPPLMLCETSINPWDPPCHLTTTPPYDWRVPVGSGKVYDCWTPNYANRIEQLDAVACQVNIMRNAAAANQISCPGSALPFWVTHIELSPPDYTFFRGLEVRLVPDLHLITPPPPPACEITLNVVNNFPAPYWRQINVHSPVGAFLPGNMTIEVTPQTTPQPVLALMSPYVDANTYITNLLVPNTGGPWTVKLSLPPLYVGCTIAQELWPDVSLPQPFIGAKPKGPQDIGKALDLLDSYRKSLVYTDRVLTQLTPGTEGYKAVERSRSALVATMTRTGNFAMDPINESYQTNPPALSIPSLGPALKAGVGLTGTQAGTMNKWHIKLMTIEANLARANQWIDKMMGALLNGDDARAVVLAKGADTNIEAAYVAGKAEIALRKTMHTQWATTQIPTGAHCLDQAMADDIAASFSGSYGFIAVDALPITVILPNTCVSTDSWPSAITEPSMRTEMLNRYLILHNISIAANLCASTGVC